MLSSRLSQGLLDSVWHHAGYPATDDEMAQYQGLFVTLVAVTVTAPAGTVLAVALSLTMVERAGKETILLAVSDATATNKT